MSKTTNQCIGVDIAKTSFVADLPGGTQSFAQDKPAYARFIKLLPANAHIVCEATGGYEQPLVEALQAGNIIVSVVMPGRVRAYARSQGILAKNDRIDAHVLSRFGAVSSLRVHEPLSQAQCALRALMHARSALIEQLKRETNHAEHPSTLPLLIAQAAERKRLYKTQLKAIAQEIETLIASDAQLRERCQRCGKVKGVGKITLWTMLCELPELGTLQKGQASALLGVAPMCQDSGDSHGRRSIKAGRARARRVFYMAAVSASRSNPILRVFYQRLRAKGKAPKLAFVAVMRKLVELLNTLIKNPNFILAG